MARDVKRLEVKGVETTEEFTGDTGKDYHTSSDTTIPLNESHNWITKHKLNDVGHKDEDSDTFSPTDDVKLIVTDDEDEEVVRAVSNRYNLVQNAYVVEILAEVLEDFNLEHLTFGQVKAYRNSVYVDLYIDHDATRFSVRQDIDGDEKIVGLQVQAGNDRTTSISSTPFILDEAVGSRIMLDDVEYSMKHTKSTTAERKEVHDDIYTMIATGIISTGFLSEELIRDVHEASNVYVDFGEYEFDVKDFYHEWVPSQVSEKAISGAVMMSQHRAGHVSMDSHRVVENATLSAWHIITGFTWSLNNKTNLSEGPNLDRYHKTARKALSNPEVTVNNVIESLEEKLSSEEENEEEDILDKARQTERELSQLEGKQRRLNEISE